MENKFSYFIVGSFVLILSCVLVIWGAWLFSTGKGKIYSSYIVYMNESVAGLNVNSPVKYNGVDVGYVAKISLDERDPQRVRLLLDIERGTPINAGTTATMMTQGLTGISYIGLKMLDVRLGPITIPPGEEYPVIKAAPSLLLRLDTSLTKLVRSLENVSRNISQILTPENSKAIAHTLSNLDRITTGVTNQDLEKVDIMLDNGAQSSEELTPMMTKLNDTATDIQQLTERLSANPSIIIRGQQPPPPGPGE